MRTRPADLTLDEWVRQICLVLDAGLRADISSLPLLTSRALECVGTQASVNQRVDVWLYSLDRAIREVDPDAVEGLRDVAVRDLASPAALKVIDFQLLQRYPPPPELTDSVGHLYSTVLYARANGEGQDPVHRVHLEGRAKTIDTQRRQARARGGAARLAPPHWERSASSADVAPGMRAATTDAVVREAAVEVPMAAELGVALRRPGDGGRVLPVAETAPDTFASEAERTAFASAALTRLLGAHPAPPAVARPHPVPTHMLGRGLDR
jgi:hypothetical protein